MTSKIEKFLKEQNESLGRWNCLDVDCDILIKMVEIMYEALIFYRIDSIDNSIVAKSAIQKCNELLP